MSKTQKRGQLTDRIKEASTKLLGYEMDKTELRLFPYIVDVMMNDQYIKPNLVSRKDREILEKWRKLGHIEGGASGLRITRQFWDICTEILFLGYVDLSE